MGTQNRSEGMKVGEIIKIFQNLEMVPLLHITEEILPLVGAKMRTGTPLKMTLEKRLKVPERLTNIQRKGKNLHTALLLLTTIERLDRKMIDQKVPRADTQQNEAGSK